MTDHIPNQEPRCLRINDRAPHFVARSTNGILALDDYKGKWLIFFSHPADFTPVCTSEFIAFQQAYDDFRAMNCELIGLSADSIYSHLAWIINIQRTFGVEITFPIIEDLSLSIAELYNMIDETSTSTGTIRSVFIINPDGLIKAMIHYPISVGRSVDEIKRLLTALTETASGETFTPANWKKGDDKLLSAPMTLDEAKGRLSQENSGQHKDWFYVPHPADERADK